MEMFKRSMDPPGPGGWSRVSRPRAWPIDPIRDSHFLARKFGDVVRYRALGRQYYQFTHPDACYELLATKAHQFHATIRSQTALIYAPNEWASTPAFQHGIPLPSFSPDELSAFADSMVHLTRRKLDLGQLRIFNIHEVLSDISLASVAELLFGREIRPHAAEMREVLVALNAVRQRRSWVPKIWPPRVHVFERGQGGKAMSYLRQLVADLVQRRRLHPDHRKDWLSRLVDACDAAGIQSLERDGIPDRALAILLMGRDAISHVLTWAVYLLTKHPAVQNNVAREIHAICVSDRVTSQQIQLLAETERVLNETLRLHPATYVVAREAIEVAEISGYQVPRRALCFVPVDVMHRDPRWFDSPEDFRPGRSFSDGVNETARRAFLPFGWGPQTCILRQFVMLGGALILAAILQNYSVLSVDGFPEPQMDPTTPWQKNHGPFVQLRRRR